MERDPDDDVVQFLAGDGTREEIRVLAVDDNRNFVELTAESLEREDDAFTVLTATSAADGLDRLDADRVDCIVSDYDMPRMDGIEFLRTVRDEHGDLPFVLFTGKGSERVASDAISAGVTDYLQKGSGSEQYELLANRIRNGVAADRVERKASDRLHELQQVLKTVPTAVTRVDRSGEIVYANREAQENLGVEPTEAVGRTYDDPQWNITDPDGEPIPEEELPFRQVLDTGEPVKNYRHNIVDGSGTRRTIEVNGAPLFDDGTVESVVFSITDVTDEIDRIRELERYETFLENSPDFVTVLDESGSVQYQSPTPEDVAGFEPRTLIGEAPEEYIHSDDRERVRSDFERVLASDPEETIRTEFRLSVASGKYRWFENRATNYLDNDSIDGIIVATRDITDRKEAETYLAEYASTVTQLQECTQNLLETTDLDDAADATIAGLKDAFEFDLAGVWMANADRTELEPITLTDRTQELIEDPPVYSAEMGSLSWEAFESGRARVIQDMATHGNRYNQDTPIRSELIVPLGEHGVLNIGSTDTSAFDRQDLHRVEVWGSLVESTLARLDQIERLEEREQELQRERNRLEEFSSFVSHDLRNPLNVAQLQLELAKGEGENTHLVRAENALDRMEQLIGDLLTLARQGATVGETEPVPLRQLLSGCWTNVESGRARLIVEVDGTIRADRSRLTSVVENLFRNAVEHGGEEVRITVGRLEGDDGIYVADDGPGISEDAPGRVFESGYSTTADGTGFGLAIVERIVDAHGWDIEVTDGASGGARFEITGVEFVN
ncbi:MAG: PAS domain S-box protein [Halobacteriales archaeon]